MRPQRFWAVIVHGDLYAHRIYEDRATAKENAECSYGHRNCPECQLRLVRVEVRVVPPKPRKRKARRAAK